MKKKENLSKNSDWATSAGQRRKVNKSDKFTFPSGYWRGDDRRIPFLISQWFIFSDEKSFLVSRRLFFVSFTIFFDFHLIEVHFHIRWHWMKNRKTSFPTDREKSTEWTKYGNWTEQWTMMKCRQLSVFDGNSSKIIFNSIIFSFFRLIMSFLQYPAEISIEMLFFNLKISHCFFFFPMNETIQRLMKFLRENFCAVSCARQVNVTLEKFSKNSLFSSHNNNTGKTGWWNRREHRSL